MSFRFIELELPGLVLIEETRHGDARGFFAETFRQTAFREGGVPDAFVQDNHARSTRGVLRGLHYQLPPRAQGKLVRVVRGEVYDVVVDLRKGSPGYGRWAGTRLSGDDRHLLWIPPGFAHGYLVLSERVDLTYKVTAEFDPGLDRGIRWDDPEIGVEWPDLQPVLSARDLALPPLSEADNPSGVVGPRSGTPALVRGRQSLRRVMAEGRGPDEPTVGGGTPFVETSQGGLFFMNAVMAAPALLVLWPVLIRALLRGVGALEGPSPLLDPVPALARQVGPYVAWLSAVPLWTCRRNLGMSMPAPAQWAVRAFVVLHAGVLGWWVLAVANG